MKWKRRRFKLLHPRARSARGWSGGGEKRIKKSNYKVYIFKQIHKAFFRMSDAQKFTAVPSMRVRDKGCKCTHEECKLGWIIVAVIFIILTCVNVAISTAFVAQQDSIFRMSFVALPQNVIGAPGEVNARVTGMITIDQNDDAFSFIAQTVAGMTGITAIHIRGPIPLGSSVGPLAVSLCGAPNSVPCDITTLPGQVSGRVPSVYDGIVPEGTSVRPLFLEIRAKPFLYYVEILTNAKPVTPGAVRADLTATCGFA